LKKKEGRAGGGGGALKFEWDKDYAPSRWGLDREGGRGRNWKEGGGGSAS